MPHVDVFRLCVRGSGIQGTLPRKKTWNYNDVGGVPSSCGSGLTVLFDVQVCGLPQAQFVPHALLLRQVLCDKWRTSERPPHEILHGRIGQRKLERGRLHQCIWEAFRGGILAAKLEGVC